MDDQKRCSDPMAGDAPVLRRAHAQPPAGGERWTGAASWWPVVRPALAVALSVCLPTALFAAAAVVRPAPVDPVEPAADVTSVPTADVGCPPAEPGPAGARVDADGDGCLDTVRVTPGRVEVVVGDETVAYGLGTAGDQVVIGDWDCNGTATPLVYRGRTGAVYEFARWPADGRPAAPTTRWRRRDAVADVVSDGGCDRLELRDFSPEA